MSGSFPVMGITAKLVMSLGGLVHQSLNTSFQAILLLPHLGRISQLKHFFLFLKAGF